MIGIKNLEEYNYFVDQGGLWQDFSRLEENITHIVRKGIFMEDGDVAVEDVILSLCGLYHFSDENVVGEFDIDWFNAWVETGACEKCFEVITKREFQKWFTGDYEGSEKLRETVKEVLEEQENE